MAMPAYYSRQRATDLIARLQETAPVAIFGGLLRDLCFETNRTFYSDVDLVVDSRDEDWLAHVLTPFNAIKNRFDGYRLHFDKWKVDIWPLSKTWAFRQGLVEGERFEDLLQTPFFDWDAIVFDLSARKLYCADDYLDKLRARTVDIILPDNPNPLGIVVRALRLAVKRRARFSRRLAEYVHRGMDEYGIYAILENELKSYGENCANDNLLLNNYLELRDYRDSLGDMPFEPYDPQFDIVERFTAQVESGQFARG